jgi:myo-inositol-1-phosphate synthase
MINTIKTAIIGTGNCCASLVMGLEYYKNIEDNNEHIPGLMNPIIGGYKISDIRIVAAFDIDARKVGLPLNKAIFQLPNCTKIFYPNLSSDSNDVNYPIVKMGKILDGFSNHLLDYDEKYRIVKSEEKEPSKEDVIRYLKESETEILILYLPVGSQKATEFYAECCLEAGVSLINAIPQFIASDPEWANRFKSAGLPVLGDDVKSQLGATIIHRTLVKLFENRGVKLDRTYQLNTAGNLDFLNMLDKNRLKSKKISKTEAVQSTLSNPLDNDNIHIGPSDYVPFLKDNKIAYIRMEGKLFGDIPMNLELRLSVEDSPDSAGCIIDCIRLAKLAIDRKFGGPLIGPSAFYFKRPPEQHDDDTARRMVENFIKESTRQTAI